MSALGHSTDTPSPHGEKCWSRSPSTATTNTWYRAGPGSPSQHHPHLVNRLPTEQALVHITYSPESVHSTCLTLAAPCVMDFLAYGLCDTSPRGLALQHDASAAALVYRSPETTMCLADPAGDPTISAKLGRTITAPIAFCHRKRTKLLFSGPQSTSCEQIGHHGSVNGRSSATT